MTKKVSAIIVAAWHYASFSLCWQAEAVGAEHFHCRFRALRWKSYVRRRPLLLARVDERRCFFSRCSGGGSVLPGRPARPGRLRPVRRRCRFDFSSPERESEREKESEGGLRRWPPKRGVASPRLCQLCIFCRRPAAFPQPLSASYISLEVSAYLGF